MEKHITAMLCLAILLVLAPLPAAAESDFYSGFLDIHTDKPSYSAGERLGGTADIGNSEGIAFNDGYIVIEVVSGSKGALGYPSQLGDEGTVISEAKVDAKLAAGAQHKVGFSVPLPADLKAGTYTLEAYYLTKRAPVVGIAHIFASPVKTEFTVAGTGEFPQLSIVRTKTTFNGQAGPVGPPVKPSGLIPGKVFVKNNSAKDIDGNVWVGLCSWDDTSCDTFISTDSKATRFSGNSETKTDLSLAAPQLSGAYAIRIEVRDNTGRLVSLYRNRAIVTGATARIKKLDISSQKLNTAEQATVRLLLGSSPDHYTDPDFNDFDLKVWVDGNGAKLFEKTTHVDSLRFAEVERPFTFTFSPSSFADSFTVCSSVVKADTEMDRYCFAASGLPSQSGLLTKGTIDVKTVYNQASGKLSLNVCGVGKDEKPEALDIGAMLMEEDSGKKLLDSKFTGKECYSESVSVNPSKHLLVVNDFRNSGQVMKELDFSPPAAQTCSGIGGFLCTQGQECNAKVLASQENGVCCSTQCASQQGITEEKLPQGSNGLGGILIPAAILLAMAIIALALYAVAKKRRGGEEAYGQ